MAVAKRIRSALLTLLAVLGILLWLVALLSFTRVTDPSDDFAQREDWILLFNSVGIVVLLSLIVINLWQLVRDYRRHVPGSRLRARMVSVLVMVAITPLVGVYIFSVEFINRGIDNWLNVDVEKGLADALELGQTVLGIQTRERLEEVQAFARELSDLSGAELARKVNALRASSEALEVTVYGNNQILGLASDDLIPGAPRYPNDEVLLQLRQNGQYVSAEPQANGEYRILAAAAIRSPTTNEALGFVQATFPMEQRLSVLAKGVADEAHDLATLGRGQATPMLLHFNRPASELVVLGLGVEFDAGQRFASRGIVADGEARALGGGGIDDARVGEDVDRFENLRSHAFLVRRPCKSPGMGQLQPNQQVIRALEMFSMGLDQEVAQAGNFLSRVFVDNQLIRIGAAIWAHGCRFASPDQLGPAAAKVFPTPPYQVAWPSIRLRVPAFHSSMAMRSSKADGTTSAPVVGSERRRKALRFQLRRMLSSSLNPSS